MGWDDYSLEPHLAAQEPRAIGLAKRLIDPVHALAETRHRPRTERPHAWPKGELTPCTKELAFELEEGVGALELRRAARRQRRILRKRLFGVAWCGVHPRYSFKKYKIIIFTYAKYF